MLDKVGQVQSNFLHKLNISEREAFLEFNFAPTILRRNIGILGLIHKRVLGLCHPSFEALLPWYGQRFPESRGLGHSKQLYGHSCEINFNRALFGRSIFAMIDIYNNLPQGVVDIGSVASFQSTLTSIAKERCKQNMNDWHLSFNRREGPDVGLDEPVMLD